MSYPLAMHRPYRSEADLKLLLDWLGTHAGTIAMHPGDLTWWLRQNENVDPAQALELFFSGAGEVQGFVFSDPLTWAVMQGAPQLPPVAWDEMIAHAEAKAGAAVTFNTYDQSGPQHEALKRAGYAPTTERLARLERQVVPSDTQAVALQSGFHFADMNGEEIRPEARVKLHQDIWHPSKVTLKAYAHLQAAPNYLPGLDLMVVAPSGELACYALGWYDPISRTGLMEPVGTRASFRRQGLGQQLIRELTRRLAAVGAQRISIGTRESNAAALALYRSAGYTVTGYWTDFKRV